MRILRITETSHLPPAGPLSERARERGDVDFKTYADPKKGVEHAKDLAALANTLGGALIVGADNRSSRVEYPGLKKQIEQEVMTIYEQAAQQRCSPPLAVDPVPMDAPNGVRVVAVNVHPIVDTVAGVRDKGSDFWRFPIRVGSQTKYLEPKELPLYIDVQVRRAVILLNRVLDEKVHKLTLFHLGREVPVVDTGTAAQLMHRRNDPRASLDMVLEEVRVHENVMVCSTELESQPVYVRVPLRDVVDVWKQDQHWAAKVAGDFRRGTSEARAPTLRYQPNWP